MRPVLTLHKDEFEHKTTLSAIAVLLLLVLLLPFRVRSSTRLLPQKMEFTHLSTKDELGSGNIKAILQDRTGFIWIASPQGLFRFDGYHFLPVSDTKVEAICLDKNDNLWIWNDDGLFRYDPVSRTLAAQQVPASIQNWLIQDIYEDSNGILWFISLKFGICRYDPGSAEFRILERNSEDLGEFSGTKIACLAEDSQHRMWFGTFGAGLILYDPITRKSTRYQIDLLERSKIRTILIDPGGTLWIATYEDGLIRFNPSTGLGRRVTLYHDSPDEASRLCIDCLHRDQFGNIWVGTANAGLFIFSPESNTPIHIRHNPLEPNSLSDDAITTIYLDQMQNLWIGTINQGINIFRFRENFNRYGSEDGLSDSHITSICPDGQGSIWIGTKFDGLNQFNLRDKTFRYYSHDDQNLHSVSHDRIQDIFKDSREQFWIGTRTGLDQFDAENGNFVHYQIYDDFYPKHPFLRITSILQKDERNLWIGTNNGLFQFDMQTHRYTGYDPSAIIEDDPSPFGIIKMAINHEGILWLGVSNYGIVQFDPGTETFRKLPLEDDIPRLKRMLVTSIWIDDEQNLWIGTGRDGLIYYNTANNNVRVFTDEDGLPGQKIGGILQDRKGFIWINTDKGLSKIDPKNLEMSNFRFRDKALTYLKEELQGANYYWNGDTLETTNVHLSGYNYGCYCIDENGYLYFGSYSGFIRFHPDSIALNASSPNLVITDFKILGEEIHLDQPIYDLKNITLTYRDNYFSVEFSLLDFLPTDQKRYFYMIQGLDKDWISCGNQNYVSYANIAPGNYTLRVKGYNDYQDLGSSGELAVQLQITPPYWQTGWFKIVSSLLAITVIAFLIWWRIATIQWQKQRLEELVKARTRELHEKSDALREARDELEKRVIQRTAELADANQELRREIIERKRIESALRNSEKTARELLNAPVDLAMLLDPAGLILAVNKSMAQSLGSQESQLIGQSISNFLPDGIIKSRYQVFKECLNIKRQILFEDQNNGRVFLNNFYPVMDDKNEVQSVAAYAIDITNQKRAEEVLQRSKEELELLVAQRTEEIQNTNLKLVEEIHTRKKFGKSLRLSEEKFRDLFENANDIIWTTDTTGRLVTVNRLFASITGCTKDQLTGQPAYQYIYQSHRFMVLRKHLMVLKGESVEFETEIADITLIPRIVWIKLRPIRENGKITGVHGIARDISALKRAEKELKEAERLKRESLHQLILKIAHEIKNPLASIKSSAQLVEGINADLANQRIGNHMEIIDRNVDLCNQTIRDLYDFTTTKPYQFVKISPVQFLIRMQSYALDKATQSDGIEVEADIPDHIPPIYADEFRLTQAFSNLINNAIEAMPAGGTLGFRLEHNESDQRVIFKICDTGCGIAEEKLGDLFEPFYSTKPMGFGLGLPLVEDILQAHGAGIQIDSRVGQGTCFTLSFPYGDHKI